MPLAVGGQQIADVRVGATGIARAYVGADLVWTAEAEEPFSPDDLGDLLGWYDGEQINQDADSPVSQWDDRHTTERHLGQGTAAQQPTLRVVSGLQVVEFDGVDDSLLHGGSEVAQPNTYFLMAKADTAAGDVELVVDGRSSTRRNSLGTNSDNRWFIRGGSNVHTANNVRDTDWHVFTVVLNGASSFLRIDGTQVASGDAGSQAWLYVHMGVAHTGGGNFFKGFVAEFIPYSALRSAGEIEQVEGYLSSKWAALL